MQVVQAEPADYAEPHLTNIKQLIFGGENAEAYFSYDGKKLLFASNRNGEVRGETNIFIVDCLW